MKPGDIITLRYPVPAWRNITFERNYQVHSVIKFNDNEVVSITLYNDAGLLKEYDPYCFSIVKETINLPNWF